ncbi:MAG: DUF4296 domain-containing protein [Hymenobacter sp.]|nr:DUF4296 domain-containing protein [Hymenobacter sp.]
MNNPLLRLYALVLSLLLVGLLPGCQRPDDAPPPQPLMPREQLVRLLADLHQLEAQVENSRLSPDSARALYLQQQKGIFWRREVTDSLFQQSYRYYASHGIDLDDIYGTILDTLALRQTKLSVPAKK